MKCAPLNTVALIALIAAAGAEAKWFFGATAEAQTALAMPTFEVDHNWPQVPSNFKMGDVSSIAIDDKDNAWVLSRPRTLKGEDARRAAPPIMMFDAAGNFIRGWGGQGGAAWQWPQREHGILIDSKGYVWIGGNSCPSNGLGLEPVSDDQLLKFRQDGTFVMQIGTSNLSQGNADTANLHRPADAQFYPQTNELFVADGYGNHRVIVFDADTGNYKRMWGAFGNTPVNDDHCEVVQHTDFSGQGPENFSIVHAIRISHDGMVYVADRENRRVQEFTLDGRFVKQIVNGDQIFARDLAFSADPDQQYLYTGYGKGIAVLDRKRLEYIGTVQPEGILGAGHHIQTDSKGNLYIAQTSAGMQRLLFKGQARSAENTDAAQGASLEPDTNVQPALLPVTFEAAAPECVEDAAEPVALETAVPESVDDATQPETVETAASESVEEAVEPATFEAAAPESAEEAVEPATFEAAAPESVEAAEPSANLDTVAGVAASQEPAPSANLEPTVPSTGIDATAPSASNE